MIRYAKGRGMQLMIVTNGSRLSEPIAKGMVEAQIDRVNISLNAGTPETYPHIHVTESPQDYFKVKKNLRLLSDYKIAAGSDLPFISALSFVIKSKNYFEIARMIEVTHEVGAQEADFVHAVLHDGTSDLAMNEAQYQALQASLPAARDEGHGARRARTTSEPLAPSTRPTCRARWSGRPSSRAMSAGIIR